MERRSLAGRIGLLAVNIRRQPHTWLHIHAPAVKMQVCVVVAAVAVGSVETDDVKLLVLNPNAANEQTFGCVLSRHHVNHVAANLAKELLPDEVKRVVLFLEVPVEDSHLSEPFRNVMALERGGEQGKGI